MNGSPQSARAFVYRAGVRIAGTVVACDAAAGSDLVFLSHAAVLGARTRRALPRLGGSRRQVLVTDTTLTLLGPVGDRLRAQALVVSYGRPFALGDLRLEIYPSGHLPGAASLLCERDGRRVVYTGPIGEEAELRTADALCLDARFAARDVVFPKRAVAEESLRAMASPGSAGGPPLFLIDPLSLAPLVARALSTAGLRMRAPRAVLEAIAAFRRVAPPSSTAPNVQRYAGRLADDEVLLWPAEARPPALAGRAAARPRILVSPRAGVSTTEPVGPARAVRFPFGGDLVTLVQYVEATGASEVALWGAPDDALAEALRLRGRTVYPLGPPRQIDLFVGG
jgi:hypothetical protein